MAKFITPVLFLYKIKNFEIQAPVAARVPPWGETVRFQSGLAGFPGPATGCNLAMEPGKGAGKAPDGSSQEPMSLSYSSH